jgi:hypothetical protein
LVVPVDVCQYIGNEALNVLTVASLAICGCDSSPARQVGATFNPHRLPLSNPHRLENCRKAHLIGLLVVGDGSVPDHMRSRANMISLALHLTLIGSDLH